MGFVCLVLGFIWFFFFKKPLNWKVHLEGVGGCSRDVAESPCGETEAGEHAVGGGKRSGWLPPILPGPAQPEQPSPELLPSATLEDPAMPRLPSEHPPSKCSTPASLIQKKPWAPA